jgi:predicted transcriptional regulator of viral defense system
MSSSAASQVMASLAANGLAVRIRHGLWIVGEPPRNRLVLIPALTAPSPAYVSFASALNIHGLIDQLPREVMVASTGRPRLIQTQLGAFRIHRIPPALFGGWNEIDGAWIAVPEKAIFDIAYVAAVRGKRANVPELELPDTFDLRIVEPWLERVASRRLRTLTRQRIEIVLQRATR